MATSNSQSTRCSTGILSLPDELLLPIFYASLEPNLTRTCRELRGRLPREIDFYNEVALLAFEPEPRLCASSLLDHPHICQTPPLHHGTHINHGRALSGLSHQQLQIEVSGSRWLTPSILKAAHVRIYQHILREGLLSPGNLLPENERALLEEILWDAEHDYGSRKDMQDDFDLVSFRLLQDKLDLQDDLLDEDSPVGLHDDAHKRYIYNTLWKRTYPELQENSRYLEAHHSQLKMWHARLSTITRRKSTCRMRTIKVVSIPDCILRDVTDPVSYALLQTFASTRGKRNKMRLEGSTVLVEQAFLMFIREAKFPDRCQNDNQHAWWLSWFNVICRINNMILRPVPVTAEMLTAAVTANKPTTLHHLFRYAAYRTQYHGDDYDPAPIANYTTADLLKLELLLGTHQCECANILLAELEADKHGVTISVAKQLGFADTRDLREARQARRKARHEYMLQDMKQNYGYRIDRAGYPCYCFLRSEEWVSGQLDCPKHRDPDRNVSLHGVRCQDRSCECCDRTS